MLALSRTNPTPYRIAQVRDLLDGAAVQPSAVTVAVERGNGTVLVAPVAAPWSARYQGYVAPIPALGVDLDTAQVIVVERLTVDGVVRVERVPVAVVG